jgi:outer membrane protein
MELNMFKKYFSLLAVCLLMVTFTKVYAQKAGAIGVVDFDKIVKEMPEYAQADKVVKDLNAQFTDSLKNVTDAFRKRAEQYQKQKSMMTADQQKKEEESLANEQQESQQLYQALMAELQKKSNEILEPIIKKVKLNVEAVAKDEKLSLVLDKGRDVIIYSDDSMDITFKVLDKIKRGKN